MIQDSKKDAKDDAYRFFNKCDLEDLKRDKICLVDTDRIESFISLAKSQGITPNGGAFTENMKAQYFYV